MAVSAQTPALVKDINKGSDTIEDGFPGSNLVACKSYLYFTGGSHQTGKELWRTDETEAGPRLVVEGDRGRLDLLARERGRDGDPGGRAQEDRGAVYVLAELRAGDKPLPYKGSKQS